MPKTDDADDNKDLDDATKIQNVVENANAEDENDSDDEGDQEDKNSDEDDSKKDDDASDEDDSEDDKSDDDDDDDEDKSDKEESERKFKNLAADDDAGYIDNLEKAYTNSSAEAVRLNQELQSKNRQVDSIIAAAQKDPDLAKRLNKVLGNSDDLSESGKDTNGDGNGVDLISDPFLVNSKTEWEEQSKEEIQEILDANPEIATDPEKNANVRHWMEVFSQDHFKNKKRLMSGGKAMEAAMKHLGIEDKRVKPSTASKAKDLAAPSRARGGKKKPSKNAPVSDLAYKFGEMMGVSKDIVEKNAQK